MSELKRPLGIDVLTAARQRIAYTFDHFERIYVSFSGGKDSTVMLHLVMDEAIRRGRMVGVLFIDWEAQYRLTIEHVREMLDLYREHIEPFWVTLPLRTVNAVSMHEPEWTCWDPEKRDLWVRDLPPEAIADTEYFDFWKPGITFEEFIVEFGKWYATRGLPRTEHTTAYERTACFIGIRTDESFNRLLKLRVKKHREFYRGRMWLLRQKATLLGIYSTHPIYDWKTEDIWTYLGRERRPYNPLYDRMHQAGLSIHQMRICEPYGDEQRKGLWLFHVIEPETWARVAARVAGANSGALYAQESGNVLGNLKIALPKGHTWQSFAQLLLDTMPPATAEHYRNKIAVYVQYCTMHYPQYANGIPDTAPGDTGSKDVPSWRRVCKVLLRNQYWCQSLSFSPTKNESYERYKRIMKRRRAKWGII